MLVSNIVSAVLIYLAINTDAAYVVFKRTVGTRDAMDIFNISSPPYRPIQQSPIYAIQCLDRGCINQRFLTVRYQNQIIVKYVSQWAWPKLETSGRWTITCPQNMLSLGFARYEPKSKDIFMICGAINTGFLLTSSTIRIEPPSIPYSVSCPNGMYMQGIECYNDSCERRGLKCVELQYKRLVQGRFDLRRSDNRQIEGDWFNSENGLSQKALGPIFAMSCSGRNNCANKRYYFVQRGMKQMLGKIESWPWLYSLLHAVASCPKGTVAKQFKCALDLCHRIDIGCAKPANKKLMVMDNDRMSSNAFSPNWSFQNIGFCPEGYYIREITCLNLFCTSMRLGCVKMVFVE